MMENALVPLFEGKEIRAIEQGDEPWFPLVDLAAAWGLKPNTLYQIITRNPRKYTGFTYDVHVTCTESVQAVNERGLYLLMGAINTDRLKDRTAAEALLRFQRWVPELIQKYRKKEIVQAHPSVDINAELQRAKMLAQETGGNLQAFQAIEEQRKGKDSVLIIPVQSYVNLLLEAGAELRSMGRVKWIDAISKRECTDPSSVCLFILKGVPG